MSSLLEFARFFFGAVAVCFIFTSFARPDLKQRKWFQVNRLIAYGVVTMLSVIELFFEPSLFRLIFIGLWALITWNVARELAAVPERN